MRRLWLITFLLVLAGGQLAVGMRASRTAAVTGDEPFYLLTAQSLSSDGDLDLADEYRNGEESAFWDGTIPLWKQMEPTEDGRLLSPHDPGLSLLVLPAYRVGGLRGAQRFLVAVWAAAMACGAVLARRVGVPPWAGLLAATVVGVGAPGVVYASQIYPEAAAALCMALGLLVATGERARPMLLAASLVALAWLGVKYVPLAGLVAAVWAWRFRDDRRTLLGAGALLAAASVHFAWWHLHTFDGLTPYGANVVWAGEGTVTILDRHVAVGERSYRLHGLFLDARFGLFRWLPAGLLMAWGLGRRTATHTAVLVVCVLLGTFLSITMMGWWFPGRMLVAGFPVLVVLIAAGAARLPRTSLVLGGWSLAIGVSVAWAAHRGEVYLAVNPFELGFPLAPHWLFPDFRSITPQDLLLSTAWIGVTVLLALATGRAGRRKQAGRVTRREGSPLGGPMGRDPEGQDPPGREVGERVAGRRSGGGS